MRKEHAVKLSEQEQDHLIRAIETAIEVGQQEQFQAWMRGPFRTLLPHDIVVCMELGGSGAARQVDCLHHNLDDAATLEFLCNPQHGLAVRLATSLRGSKQTTCALDAHALDALLDVASSSTPRDPGQLQDVRNAIVHQTKFLSGAAYFFLLLNVPEDQVERCRHMFKLLSSHLKMALSRAIAAQAKSSAAALTRREIEILHWMREGKSNNAISGILGISAMTVKDHISKLYRKLDVQNRVEAVSKGRSLLPGHAVELPLPQGKHGKAERG